MRENFIKKAMIKFNGKFNYDKFIYKNAKTKSIIICPLHGEFLQNPDKHLNSKYGCRECWEIERKLLDRSYSKGKKVMSKSDFLKRVLRKYKNKFEYNLDNFNGLCGNDIEVYCKKHDFCFLTSPHTHLLKNNKYGCSYCSKEGISNSKTIEYNESIKFLCDKYDNLYIYPDYNKNNYKNKRSKIEIICKKHGKFIKSVTKHQSGQGCPNCKKEELVKNNILGVYNDKLFEVNPLIKSKKAILYYLNINNGVYYKIGITTISVESRIKSLKSRSKGFIETVEILYEKEMDLYEAYKKENSILKENSDFRVYRRWSTEIFNKDILRKPLE